MKKTGVCVYSFPSFKPALSSLNLIKSINALLYGRVITFQGFVSTYPSFLNFKPAK